MAHPVVADVLGSEFIHNTTTSLSVPSHLHKPWLDAQCIQADPVGWTSDEVVRYIRRRPEAFANPEGLSEIVVQHKLTGRYFVEMDREGLREAA